MLFGGQIRSDYPKKRTGSAAVQYGGWYSGRRDQDFKYIYFLTFVFNRWSSCLSLTNTGVI